MCSRPTASAASGWTDVMIFFSLARRFANERYDDRDMVASFDQIRREEARSLRMGRDEDAKAEAELARAAAAKAAAKKKAKKRAKTSVIMD